MTDNTTRAGRYTPLRYLPALAAEAAAKFGLLAALTRRLEGRDIVCGFTRGGAHRMYHRRTDGQWERVV